MGKNASIAGLVFSSIHNVVSTVETIHGDIAEITVNRNGSGTHNQEKRKNVYDLIKSINGNISSIVSDFLR